MATRGEQKIDEKKLQKAVESWVKAHRAKIADQRMQAAVDDFVKQHRKEVGDRGMRIIRRVIAEGRTTPTVKSKTPTRGSSLRTEDRRPKVTKQGVEKMVKTATDKAKPTVKSATSRVGALSKLGTGAGLLLVSEPLGGGVDAKDPSKPIKQTERGKKQVPAGEMGMPAPARGSEKGRGDGAAEVKARKAEAKPAPKAESKPKPTPKPTAKPENKATTEAKKKAAMEKARATDRAGVESRKETARKENARREALRAHNKRITAMSPAERKKYRESEAGKSGKLLKNRGGSVSKYSSGGMAQRANCGASMRPTQKSSRGIK